MNVEKEAQEEMENLRAKRKSTERGGTRKVCKIGHDLLERHTSMSHQQQQHYAPEMWHLDEDIVPPPESQAYAQYFDSPGGVDYYDQQQGFDLNCSSHVSATEGVEPPPRTDALPVVPWSVASHAAFDSVQQQQLVDGFVDVVDYPGPYVDYDYHQQQLQQDHSVPSPDQTSSTYSSYSSTHRSSEDDDEVSARLVYRDDGQGGGDDDAKKKQTVAQRRIRNRESMRRTRMKEKVCRYMYRWLCGMMACTSTQSKN